LSELETVDKEKRKAERALIDSQARMSKAEEMAHFGSWKMNISTRDTVWSDEFFRICGFEPGAVKPSIENIFRVTHPDDRQRAIELVSAAIDTGNKYDIEKRIVKPDGSIRYVQSIGQVQFDIDEKPESIVGSFLDITERKQNEDDLRKYTAELEASNEELDAFAHTVAHDLKNPVNVVYGAIQQLQENFKEMTFGEINEMANIVSRSALKMTSIINELLLLASVRKMDEVTTSNIDMSIIVSNVLNRLSNEIRQSKSVIISPDNWLKCVSYAPWLEEVWINYIINAIKYGGTPPIIELGSDENSGRIRYWVRDNGNGLTKEQIPLLFTNFTRLHEFRAQGNGLGLSIVKRIIDKLGGEAGVESEVGKGSLFYFTLPKTPI
ncbi:MAG TPA: PAS domain-containing sensor histidine kinase, partial [Ignavibacteriaceae bacterium]|nr:PAS domain-containing sensor histidine kinase [Ignavibacteriaceae bacterium]